MINEAIEILTKMMITEKFKNSKKSKKINKIDLYVFSIKLLKIIKEAEKGGNKKWKIKSD